MKSNWKFSSIKNAFEKSNSTVLALALGLALGLAGGQVVHSMNEGCKDSVDVRVHADKEKHPQEKTEDRFYYPFAFDPWMRNLMHDGFFSDLDTTDMPISIKFNRNLNNLASMPRIDTNETADAMKITADVPGIEEKDLDVSVTDSMVTIKGEKKSDSSSSEKDARRSERFFGRFERSISLPFRAESQKAEAHLKNGVLTIVIPKSHLAQKETRKLTINTQ